MTTILVVEDEPEIRRFRPHDSGFCGLNEINGMA